MKIKHSVAPKKLGPLVQKTINQIVDQLDDHPFMGIDPYNLAISAPHPVHAAHLTEVMAGKLGQSEKLGLRYLLVDGMRPVADIEFNSKQKFAGLHSGPYVASTVQGATIAAQSEEHTGEFELRFLKVPGLALACLWFKSRSKNLYMPLDPAPPELKAYDFYAENELLKIIVPMANERAFAQN